VHYFPVTLFTHTNAAMASGAGLRPVSLERNYVEEGYLLEVPAKQRRTALGKDYPVGCVFITAGAITKLNQWAL
jgi:hypothetical protein